MKTKMISSVISTLIMLLFISMVAIAAETDNVQSLDKGIAHGSSEVVYDTASEQTFTVVIPKKVVLGSDKTAFYNITVKGDIAQGSSVKVQPQDDVADRDGINFVMTSTKSGGDKSVDVTQTDILWTYEDVTVDGTSKSGNINGSELTLGVWNGNLIFKINFNDEYALPCRSIDNWEYEVNDELGTVTISNYKGEETDVVVYPDYTINGKTYSTRLPDKLGALGSRGPSSALFPFSYSNPPKIRSFRLEDGVNTLNVTDMTAAFARCSSLNSVDLSNFDTSNVVNMNNMFCNSPLRLVNLSNFDTSKVTDMSGMFSGCSQALKSLDLSDFDTSNVTDMSGMFQSCKALTSINLPTTFNTSSVTDMSRMFYECYELSSLDLSNFDTIDVSDMNNMFYACTELATLDLSSFNTVSATDMSQMFYRCLKLNSIYVTEGKWNISNANTTNMFESCGTDHVINVGNSEDWECIVNDTDNTITISEYKGLDNNVVVYPAYFFNGKIYSTRLPNVLGYEDDVPYSIIISGDKLSSILTFRIEDGVDTSNVTDMTSAFYNCGLLQSVDLSNFDSSNVTKMGRLFERCISLDSVNVAGLNTSKVVSMLDMFAYDSNIASLDLSSFDTRRVSDARGMFYNCSKLMSIYVTESNWTLTADSTNYMFVGCGTNNVSPKPSN